MKKMIISTLIFFMFKVLFAQNDGFEDFNVSFNCCRNDVYCPLLNVQPFNEGYVDKWQASHGTPQLNKVGCTGSESIVHSGNNSAYISFSTNNKEGIFRTFNIKKNESFTLKIFARKDDFSGVLVVRLATGLQNEKPPMGSGNPNVAVANTNQLVLYENLTDNWEEYSAIEFTADDDYDQLWIYGLEGVILVDDVVTKKSCCESYKVYQNQINPPSTYVNDCILAGKNVTTAVPQGDVIITNTDPWVPTVFQAGTSITLGPGFSTLPGANFIAKILPCNQTPINIDIVKISSNDDPCHSQYEASACFGSGFYTFNWSENVRDGIGNSKTKIFSNGSEWFGETITVTVTDNLTNTVATKTITLPAWMPFVEPFDTANITVNNVVTPNGDGINEDWYSSDLSRPNSFIWAYNAYKVEYHVFGRWGGADICGAEKIDKINGVWDKFVFCSGYDLCNSELTSAFYWFRFENCKAEFYLEGSISVFNCTNSTPIDNYIDERDTIINYELDITKTKVEIYPNPFIDFVNIEKLLTPSEFIIYESSGRVVKRGYLKFGVNQIIGLDQLKPAIYFLHLENKIYKLTKFSEN